MQLFIGETDVPDAFMEKANYLVQISDKSEVLAVYKKVIIYVIGYYLCEISVCVCQSVTLGVKLNRIKT